MKPLFVFLLLIMTLITSHARSQESIMVLGSNDLDSVYFRNSDLVLKLKKEAAHQIEEKIKNGGRLKIIGLENSGSDSCFYIHDYYQAVRSNNAFLYSDPEGQLVNEQGDLVIRFDHMWPIERSVFYNRILNFKAAFKK